MNRFGQVLPPDVIQGQINQEQADASAKQLGVLLGTAAKIGLIGFAVWAVYRLVKKHSR